ncbi:MAG: ABC transporter substrate-binding protein [Pseudomonadota bacterium]
MTAMKRRTVLKTAAATALVLPAAGSLRAAPQRGGTFRMGKAHGQTTDTLNPATWENGFTIAMGFGIHNFMTEVAADGSLVGEIAESWEASAGATVWRFKIRQDVTFHNGRAVTANDVMASLNHHRGEDSASAAKPLVAPITNMVAEDDNTLVVELDAGNADFPFIVSDYHMPILQANDDGSVDWQSGVGCGGYVLRNFEPGVRADLERYDGYWKSDRAHFDAIEMISIIDPTARTNAFTSGEVDAIDRVDLKTVSLLQRQRGVNIHSVAGTQHYTYAMHTNTAPYDNNDVRLGLKYAIDREELVQKILKGYGVVGNDHPIGPGQRFHASDLEQRTYDPDRAKFHLEQAGLSSLDVKLSVSDAAYGGAVDAGVLYSESARAAGINLEVVREPNDGYWSNVWLVKPFSAVYWSGRPTEDWMFSTAYERGVDWNDSYWDHDRFNELLYAARAETDEAQRRQMYFDMQEICSNEGGVIVPMFASYVFATSDKVGFEDQFASNWDMDGERSFERWWFA